MELLRALLLFMSPCLSTALAQKDALIISEIAPRVTDTTSMWWKDGFPARVSDSPWLRRVQTGHYAFELNTESLAITHLAPLPSHLEVGSQEAWKKLTPAKLDLQIVIDGKAYHCQNGGQWTRQSGPRLIESGRYVQRADVTDLTFVAEDGSRLPFDTRFETIAWPKQLGLILHAKPKKDQDAARDWETLSLNISIQQDGKEWRESKTLKNNPKDPIHRWTEVFLTLDPQLGTKTPPHSPVIVEAISASDKKHRVSYDAPLVRHRINLDPLAEKQTNRSNDALERVFLTLTNPTTSTQPARLCFEKTNDGFRAFEGFPITGVSAILCDNEGYPCGIPIQLSKNWHNSRERPVYSGTWFHASTILHLPPESVTKLQLVIVCGHWGGLPAASHAQLSLIGWGSNQLWEQSALGAWGESICFEPDQAQAATLVTDVRPLMVTKDPKKLWSWTANVGGADFYRLFDTEGNRVPPSSMKATHHRTGPCLTEVTYRGNLGSGIEHATTVSIARTDDLVRATYRLRMNVRETTDFSRLALFQIGADTYNYTREKKFAIGNNDSLTKEWSTTWGGNLYRTPPTELLGETPWASLHEGEILGQDGKGPNANRGFIIRKWKAKLGGQKAQPWIRERGIGQNDRESSILDLTPPPNLSTLQAGDYLEATIEHLAIPQSSKDYYGPNQELRNALNQTADTWQMVAREANGNARHVEIKKGQLLRKFPDVRIATENSESEFTLSHGLGYVPVTFTNLTTHKDHQLRLNGKIWHQTEDKSNYWQTDYDPQTKMWSLTYNLPVTPGKSTRVQFGPPKDN